MLHHPALRYLAGQAILAAAWLLNPAWWVTVPIRKYLVETFVIPSTSMSPALTTGDGFFVNKRTGCGRWSIVGFDSLNNRSIKFAKHIVALPGETVQVVEGEIEINGKIVPRPPDVPPYRDPRESSQGTTTIR